MSGEPARPETLSPSPATANADYSFRQRFRVPARFAFRWCVDFHPDDSKLSDGHASRKVVQLAPNTVALDDEFLRSSGERIRKVKLVQVYPTEKHWVSTHIVGPNHYSQFRYTIVPDGAKASYLLFEGRDVVWDGRPLSAAANRERTRRLRTEDAAQWKQFAVTLEKDFSGR
jgi:hypothetical protein